MGMQTFDTTLPEFTRVVWVSDDARAVWEPKMRKIVKSGLELEWLSVLEEVRRCASLSLAPSDLTNRGGEWLRKGLVILPLEIEPTSNGVARASDRHGFAEAFGIRTIVGRLSDVLSFQAAMDEDNQDEMARLLGYPSCCFAHLRTAWVEEGLADPTWLIAAHSLDDTKTVVHEIELLADPDSNSLWRSVGIRSVPHIPCCFGCQETQRLAAAFRDLGQKYGFAQEVAWCREMLSWPIEWSCLHGIAEIKTPILKIATRTDGTVRKYTVRLKGTPYPAEGCSGVRFPFQSTSPKKYVTLSLDKRQRAGPSEPLAQCADGSNSSAQCP